MTAPDILEGLLVVYDLSDLDGGEAAHRHRATWGRLYTDIVALDYDHVLLVFRPAPNQRWRRHEASSRAKSLCGPALTVYSQDSETRSRTRHNVGANISL